MKVSAVLERVLKTISRYSMLPPDARVMAAVSGGADSVCLLHALRELGIPLAGVAHFNHKLRAEASEEDERFVAGLASELGLPFYRGEARLTGTENLEQAARKARRAFFAGLNADRIAVGHTRDDQAETVLFRVLRGSGLAGLAGIHPVTAEGIVRPLLEVTRAEVETFLRSRGLSWREDASNQDRRFARNRIRHELMPLLRREWNPQIGEALAQLGNLAWEEERWWADRDLGVAGSPCEIPVKALVPRAVGRRVVRRAIAAAKGNLRGIEYQHVEQVLELGSGKLQFPGVEVVRSFDWLRFAPPEPAQRVEEPVEVVIPGSYAAPDGATEIRLELAEGAKFGCANLRVELSWGRIPGPVELRAWRPGDHYQPAGHLRDQKVKELFQKGRVPSWRRRFWPMLTSGGKILWARGFGAAAEFVAGDGAEQVLRISETDIGVLAEPFLGD